MWCFHQGFSTEGFRLCRGARDPKALNLEGMRFRESAFLQLSAPLSSPWFLVRNGGMDYGDYYRGPQGTIIGIHFPHSLLRNQTVFGEARAVGMQWRPQTPKP